MTYIPNNVIVPGQIVVINPITGTPLEADTVKHNQPISKGCYKTPRDS